MVIQLSRRRQIRVEHISATELIEPQRTSARVHLAGGQTMIVSVADLDVIERAMADELSPVDDGPKWAGICSGMIDKTLERFDATDDRDDLRESVAIWGSAQ